MRKIADYAIAREEIEVTRRVGVTKTKVVFTLVESVKQLMSEGYVPHGSPLLDRKGRMNQAMIKYLS